MIDIPQTVLEINLNALTHNYEYLRSKVAPEIKMLAVVKAFGYGSDAVIIAKHLETLKVAYFAVAYASEGIQLRKAGITTPIMVLHPQLANLKDILTYNLEPNLYSIRVFETFLNIVKNDRRHDFPIHLKYNSGLNRIGFQQNDIDFLATNLKNNPSVKVVSLLSHLAASEDLEERDFTLLQIQDFKRFSEKVIQKIGYTPLLHQSNTSGILNYPEAHFSMVRTGIGLYGFGNDARYDPDLRPIASLKSVISQIHELKAGESVGYNRAFVTNQKIRTATIPIGHADGIGRQYGLGKGFVTIKRKRAYIVGNVCMDMIMVDVTTIDCIEGDEVIIFDHLSSAEVLAENAGTISYELISSISARVKRRIIDKK